MLVMIFAFWPGEWRRSAAAERVVDEPQLRQRLSGSDVRGFEADVDRARCLVLKKQGSIVGANVDDEVLGAEANAPLGSTRQIAEVLRHRLVDAGAVAV